MMTDKRKFGYWLWLTRWGRFGEELDFSALSRCKRVGKRETPDTLNGITFGQLWQLQELKDMGKMLVEVPKIVLGMTDEELAEAPTTEVVRFVAWTARELKRINDLFEKINRKPKSEEVRAGIHKLNHGLFGMADWYAKRMGIKDHEEVMSVGWIRIYQCMKKDNEVAEFEERLQKVYENDRKMRRK